MKKELHNRLAPYEPHLNTAHHASFCRTIKSSDLDELRAIYREWKGVEFNGHMTCNSCVIRLLKELYDAYHEPVEDIKDEPSPSRIIRKRWRRIPRRKRQGRPQGTNIKQSG